MGKNGRNTVEKMYDIKKTIKELTNIFDNNILQEKKVEGLPT